ncbi:MAG: flagellar filament capping protein FliD [Lachnospiraceae bacterium]|nr:flagellar filament capping protein FliD [Lachnospiraceae bacterium]
MAIGLSGFFGTSNTNQSQSIWSSGSDSGSTILSDYASIKNGTYKKLAKKYYASDTKSEADAKAEDKKLTLTKNGSESLSSSVKALMSNSLFEKKKISSKDEKTGETSEKEDYDWEAITKAVKSFVDDYNSVITDAADTNLNGVLRNTLHMTSATKANSKLLSEIGITVGKDNKLTVDEDKLKEADISTLKSVFNGSGSFADRISTMSDAITKAISNSATTYTNSGSSLPSAFSSMFETEV